jgi:hypothetical protein
MTSNYGEGSSYGEKTVINDAHPSLKVAFQHDDPSIKVHVRPLDIPRPSFVAPMDTQLEERPFFVPIGKGGLIAALQRLDQQMQNVRRSFPVTSPR